MTAWEIFWSKITKGSYTLILEGLKTTAIIAVVGLVIGIVLGSLLALLKLLPGKKWFHRLPGRVADIYIALFRGTPMVVQLLTSLPVLWEATIAFGLNSGAYVSEIMRGGILSVDKGQMEAGRALGMSYPRTMWMVILPQAVKNVVPTLGNEFIMLLKETSVVSFIAVMDVTKAFQTIANSTYEYIVPYLMLALVYLILVLGVTALVRLLERRMRAGDRD